jgi:hypothetical protein
MVAEERAVNVDRIPASWVSREFHGPARVLE